MGADLLDRSRAHHESPNREFSRNSSSTEGRTHVCSGSSCCRQLPIPSPAIGGGKGWRTILCVVRARGQFSWTFVCREPPLIFFWSMSENPVGFREIPWRMVGNITVFGLKLVDVCLCDNVCASRMWSCFWIWPFALSVHGLHTSVHSEEWLTRVWPSGPQGTIPFQCTAPRVHGADGTRNPTKISMHGIAIATQAAAVMEGGAGEVQLRSGGATLHIHILNGSEALSVGGTADGDIGDTILFSMNGTLAAQPVWEVRRWDTPLRARCTLVLPCTAAHTLVASRTSVSACLPDRSVSVTMAACKFSLPGLKPSSLTLLGSAPCIRARQMTQPLARQLDSMAASMSVSQ